MFGQRRRKVNLPHRKLSEYEKFQLLLRDEERRKARQGFETLAEANDFDVPEDPDPLEGYFSAPTKYEQVGAFHDANGLELSKELLRERKAKDATPPAPEPKDPVPEVPNA